jgi:DNA-binding NtrC family response regulator
MAEEKFPDFAAPTQLAWAEGRPMRLHVRRCRLSTAGPPETDRVFDGAAISIGSLGENDLVVTDSTVSRQHCLIVQEDEAYLLQDLGSTNGTFVDGVRVREAFLAPGCTIRVGNAEILFEAADQDVEVQPSRAHRLGDLVGADVRMRELFAIIEKIAVSGTTVVIQGETGTGKEVVARTLHQLSPRASGPFVVLDCGAVPPTLIESELFGHERGSFTGAVMTHRGVFEMAHGGTLFLDELAELDTMLQPKLLRTLETREIRRVGGVRPIKVDVRVLAATNKKLEEEVRSGRFRQDLYYRLSVVRLEVPALRERRSDIPLLVEHFLQSGAFNRNDKGKLRIRGVTQQAMDALKRYPWPGNVRELRNVVERVCSLCQAQMIRPADLPELVLKPAAGAAPMWDVPFREAKQNWIDSFERNYLLELLEKNEWNVSAAARMARMDRKHFRKLMHKHGLEGAKQNP